MFVVVLILPDGFLVGFRVAPRRPRAPRRLVLLLAFGYAMSWIFASVGLLVGDPETAQAAAFPVLAPLVFASSLFVPVQSMPGWLQPWANHQPVSVTAKAIRFLTLGDSPVGHSSDVWESLLWIAGILLVFAPLAVRRYRRAV